MILRRSTQPPPPPSPSHAEIKEMVRLSYQVRQAAVEALVEQALTAQAARPADLRNRELIDLCLDLRNALLAPTVPVIPGRP